MLRALVTGAGGFVGRHLCQRLQEEGTHVVAMGRHRSEGPWDEFIEADFEKPHTLPLILPKVDEVYHLASKAHVLEGKEPEEDEYAQIAVEGQAYLLNHLSDPHTTRYLLCSTVKAMGETTTAVQPLDEDTPAQPVTPYGRAKLRAEEALWNSPIGLASRTVVRPVAVYGNGQKGNLDRMAEAIRKRRFPALPRMRNRRSFIHVQDLAEAMIVAQRAPGEGESHRLFIACEPEPVSTTDLYESLCRKVGRRPGLLRIPMCGLRFTAWAGSFGEKLTRRRLPFNQSQLEKLTASAWYSPEKLQRAGFSSRYGVLRDL